MLPSFPLSLYCFLIFPFSFASKYAVCPGSSCKYTSNVTRKDYPISYRLNDRVIKCFNLVISNHKIGIYKEESLLKYANLAKNTSLCVTKRSVCKDVNVRTFGKTRGTLHGAQLEELERKLVNKGAVVARVNSEGKLIVYNTLTEEKSFQVIVVKKNRVEMIEINEDKDKNQDIKVEKAKKDHKSVVDEYKNVIWAMTKHEIDDGDKVVILPPCLAKQIDSEEAIKKGQESTQTLFEYLVRRHSETSSIKQNCPDENQVITISQVKNATIKKSEEAKKKPKEIQKKPKVIQRKPKKIQEKPKAIQEKPKEVQKKTEEIENKPEKNLKKNYGLELKTYSPKQNRKKHKRKWFSAVISNHKSGNRKCYFSIYANLSMQYGLCAIKKENIPHGFVFGANPHAIKGVKLRESEIKMVRRGSVLIKINTSGRLVVYNTLIEESQVIIIKKNQAIKINEDQIKNSFMKVCSAKLKEGSVDDEKKDIMWAMSQHYIEEGDKVVILPRHLAEKIDTEETVLKGNESIQALAIHLVQELSKGQNSGPTSQYENEIITIGQVEGAAKELSKQKRQLDATNADTNDKIQVVSGPHLSIPESNHSLSLRQTVSNNTKGNKSDFYDEDDTLSKYYSSSSSSEQIITTVGDKNASHVSKYSIIQELCNHDSQDQEAFQESKISPLPRIKFDAMLNPNRHSPESLNSEISLFPQTDEILSIIDTPIGGYYSVPFVPPLPRLELFPLEEHVNFEPLLFPQKKIRSHRILDSLDLINFFLPSAISTCLQNFMKMTGKTA